MLPEIGGLELLVIAAVALIVVGPKDLPLMLRKLGQFTAKVRGMANEFRASFDEMARQSELDELRKEVEAMRRGQLADSAAVDASKAQVDQVFKDIGDSLEGSSGSFQMHPPMSHQYDAPAEPVTTIEEAAPPPTSAAEKPKPRARKPKAETAAKPKAKAAPKTKTAAASTSTVKAKPAAKPKPKAGAKA